MPGPVSPRLEFSTTFVRHFARLVWLLRNESGNVDEQKMALRALVTVSKSGPVEFRAADDATIHADDRAVPGVLTGMHDLALQMAAHSVRAIRIDRESIPADVLGLARILSADLTTSGGDGGAEIRRKLDGLNARTIQLETLPARPSTSVPVEQEIKPVEPGAPAAKRVSAETAVADAGALLASLVAVDVTKLSPDELLATLDAARGDEAITVALDDLVTLAEHSARTGKAPAVQDLMYGIVTRERSQTDDDVKRAYVMAIRRLAKPTMLRAVATLIIKKPERKQYCYEVLERMGEDGADAVIESITQAPTTDDRRTLVEMLRELAETLPALTKMLGDSRWFVVRNAADLLGELGATQADEALIGLLRHTDDRVRRSVTNALMRLGTPDAVKALYDAMHDDSPAVRLQATAAIASRRDGKTSATLIKAIEDESDADVQIAMVAALGQVATADAVQKLVKMAEAEGRLFRKKNNALRVAAVQALGEVKTPAALAALKELASDKEREVREMATRALAHASIAR